jgi:hypothetical protein
MLTFTTLVSDDLNPVGRSFVSDIGVPLSETLFVLLVFALEWRAT